MLDSGASSYSFNCRITLNKVQLFTSADFDEGPLIWLKRRAGGLTACIQAQQHGERAAELWTHTCKREGSACSHKYLVAYAFGPILLCYWLYSIVTTSTCDTTECRLATGGASSSEELAASRLFRGPGGGTFIALALRSSFHGRQPQASESLAGQCC